MTITIRENKTNELTRQEMDENLRDLDSRMGFFDYNDAATSTTPIVVPNDLSYVYLTNDAAGAFTNTSFAPRGVSFVWDEVNNRFDWSELNLGDTLDIRFDINVTTTAANQYVEVDLEMASGGVSPYDLIFSESVYKTAGTFHLSRYNGLYMGNSDTLDNYARFKIKSDANATVVVNGWYVRVIKGAFL